MFRTNPDRLKIRGNTVLCKKIIFGKNRYVKFLGTFILTACGIDIIVDQTFRL